MAQARPRHVRLLATVLAAALPPSACATGAPRPDAVVAWGGDLASAVAATAAVAPGCGLKLMDGRRDEKGATALLVFLDEWQSPRPESAVVTVRLRTEGGAAVVEIAARPLADYGMEPPDIRAGSEGSGCVPCDALRADTPMVRYSRGLALGNAARASRCLGDALAAAEAGAAREAPG